MTAHAARPTPVAKVSRVDVTVTGVLFAVVGFGFVEGTDAGAFGDGPWALGFLVGSVLLLSLIARYSERISSIAELTLATASFSRAVNLFAAWLFGTLDTPTLIVAGGVWLIVTWFLIRGWNRAVLRIKPVSMPGR